MSTVAKSRLCSPPRSERKGLFTFSDLRGRPRPLDVAVQNPLRSFGFSLCLRNPDALMLTTIQGMLNSLITRLAVVAAVISTFIWSFWFGPDTLGYSAETKDGATSVSAGTTPQVMLVSLLFVAFYCLLLTKKAEVRKFRIAPMWSRVAAFAVDCWLAVFTLGGLLGFVPLLLEAARTGVFRWYFQRNDSVSSDTAGIALVLVAICAFVAYFLLPLLKGSQTIGCWIFRLATVNTDGYVVYLPLSSAMRRLGAEFRGSYSPIKTFRTRDNEGRTFYDRDSGFTVVRY
jgi:hypothetical protein